MVACPTCIGGCAHYPPPTPRLPTIPLPPVSSSYYGSRVAGMSSSSYYPYHNVIASGASATSSNHSSSRSHHGYPTRTPSALSSHSSLSSLSSAYIPSSPSPSYSSFSSGSSSLRLNPFLLRPSIAIDLTQLPPDLPERLLSQVDLRAPATHPPVRQLSLSLDITHSASSQSLHSNTILIERSEGVRCIDVLRRAAEYITLSKFSEKESQGLAVTLLANATAPAPGVLGAGLRETQHVRVPRRPADLLSRGSPFTGITQTSRQSASDDKPSFRMQLRS
ncbi:hypothetical protein SISSUDRAFT_1047361 [Sistotremastrum suecicum HHB10207 ss-3]|uniref:Uncharacterized protein n=1 Tax=Sistotremastrum suecicum HHB10207 ss-3 TaxID=1314776 RepID=A0A166D8B7_9AGAM|nr:hypothetical protein SISSUDRAFT_1047361 [Sistotremastrum suecicum HHB10207 ss-3]